MKKIFFVFLLSFNLFSQEFFIVSYPSNVSGGEGAIINPSSMVELEGFQIFSGLNYSYEKTKAGDYSSKNEKNLKGFVSASYNITEDIAVGASIFPLFFQNSSFKMDAPFRYDLRKFNYNAEERRASLGIRVLSELNIGFSLRQIDLNFSLSKSELSPKIEDSNYEIQGNYKGQKKDISFELSSLYKYKDFKFALIFRPQCKITYSYSDFSVNFNPYGDISEEVLKTLKTYYPSGGVKTEAYIPQEVIFSGTKTVGLLETSISLSWTRWSSWKNIRLDYKNETIDPSTGEDVLKDQEIELKFTDSFKLKGLISYEFSNKLKAYFEIVLREKITDKAEFAGLEMGNGIEFTLAGSYPLKYSIFDGRVFGYYTFSFFEKNNNFDYKKNFLGAGLSFSF